MSLRDWLKQGSPEAVGALAVSSVVAGAAFGFYLQLPNYMGEPVYQGEPQAVIADDPGRAKWREVISTLGGLGATFVIPAAYAAEKAPEPVYAHEVDERFDRLVAEVEAEAEGARRNASWSQDEAWNREQQAQADRREWRRERDEARNFGYAAPRRDYAEDAVVYSRAETPTVVYEDEPVPPPPPRPSFGY